MVLSACSSYFEQLFINFSEPNQIVILKDTSFLDISAIIDFMYRGEINVSQVREGLGWKASSGLIEPSLHKVWYLMRGETAEISTSPGPAQAINCCWYNKHLYFYCAGPPLLPPQDCREPQGEGSGRGVWGRQGEDGDQAQSGTFSVEVEFGSAAHDDDGSRGSWVHRSGEQQQSDLLRLCQPQRRDEEETRPASDTGRTGG